MYKAILFDMDGTLVDSERYYINGTYTWLNRYCSVTREQIYKIVGLNMEDTYSYLSSISGLDIKTIEKLNTDYFNKENVINYKNYLFDDVLDSLKQLKKKYKLALCTVSDRYMLDNFLKDCDLENTFDCLLSNDDINKSKPDPEIYLRALEKLNVNKDEAIVIEDSYNGILAGKNAGIRVYARDAGRYNINQEDADAIFLDLREIEL